MAFYQKPISFEQFLALTNDLYREHKIKTCGRKYAYKAPELCVIESGQVLALARCTYECMRITGSLPTQEQWNRGEEQ